MLRPHISYEEEVDDAAADARAVCIFLLGLCTFPDGGVALKLEGVVREDGSTGSGVVAVVARLGVAGANFAGFRRLGSSVIVYVEGDSRNVA